MEKNDDASKLSTRLGKLIPYAVRQWLSTMALIRKRKLSLIGALLVSGFLILALLEGIFKNAILPYSLKARTTPNLPPSIIAWPPNFSHIFGTDPLGRDLFSQIIAALPLDAEVALLVIISVCGHRCSVGDSCRVLRRKNKSAHNEDH